MHLAGITLAQSPDEAAPHVQLRLGSSVVHNPQFRSALRNTQWWHFVPCPLGQGDVVGHHNTIAADERISATGAHALAKASVIDEAFKAFIPVSRNCLSLLAWTPTDL